MERVLDFIDGEFVQPASGGFLDNVEPATGRVYGQLADSDERDVERAVDAARRALPAWSAITAEDRSRLLLDVAATLEQRSEDLARAESIDTGKPIRLARTVDIPRAVRNVRFFATAMLHFQSESHATDLQAINYTLRRPRGVTGCISPWNLPLYLFTWKVAPALATGNTVVAKPSELTPVTATMFAEACRDAGLPSGVLNVVHGLGGKAGAAIVRHPDVGTLTFTGGTSTGAEIARTAAPLFKKLALEMGGKNPNLVFADADMDEAIEAGLRSSFSNQGQICLCGSRIFVERPAYAGFLERLVERARELRLGDPLEEETEQGSLISRAHLDKVTSYISLAREEGGEVLCGGTRPPVLPERCRGGFFLQPAVVTGLDPGCRVQQEEIFGPVVTVTPFDDERQALEQANATRYGLSASLWTRDLSRAHRLADRIDAGTVWVNCWMLRDLRVPFGGMKHSGVGREGGQEALHFFTEPKNVCIHYPTPGEGGE